MKIFIYKVLVVNPKYIFIYLAMFIPFNYIAWIRQRLFNHAIRKEY